MRLRILKSPHFVGLERNDQMDTKTETNEQSSTWETPTFVEIRMDAEIGSYQDDFDGQDFH
jgi:hypothetical protein